MLSKPEPSVRKVAERNRPALLRYLRAEPEMNLFIVGNILAHGLSSDIAEVFIQHRAKRIEGVLLRWRTSLIPYSQDVSADLSPIADCASGFLSRPGAWMLSGKQEVVRAVEARLRRRPEHTKDHFFCVCRKLEENQEPEARAQPRMATGADAKEISAMLSRVAEFVSPQLNAEEMKAEIESGRRKVAILREPETGTLVSQASMVAETPHAAMIIAVATDGAYRGRGYASACTVLLVRDLIRRGKSACLFYNNPSAGRIYQRLGFREIGRWRLITFGRQ